VSPRVATYKIRDRDIRKVSSAKELRELSNRSLINFPNGNTINHGLQNTKSCHVHLVEGFHALGISFLTFQWVLLESVKNTSENSVLHFKRFSDSMICYSVFWKCSRALLKPQNNVRKGLHYLWPSILAKSNFRWPHDQFSPYSRTTSLISSQSPLYVPNIVS